MRIAIVVPTYNRTKKLERCIASINRQSYKNFHIYVYIDNAGYKDPTFQSSGNITTEWNEKHEYVAGSWNRFLKDYWEHDWDVMAWIVDDVELQIECLENAIKQMKYMYPDTDGVVGISQSCPGRKDYTWKPYGQCLIGRKFIERYPNHLLCCPDYYHFYQDEEMYLHADDLGKFSLADDAKLWHYHPGFKPEEMDDTHSVVRGEIKEKDNLMYKARRDQGLIWGLNDNLLGRKD